MSELDINPIYFSPQIRDALLVAGWRHLPGVQLPVGPRPPRGRPHARRAQGAGCDAGRAHQESGTEARKVVTRFYTH